MRWHTHTAHGSRLEQIISALDFTFVSIFTFELGCNLIANWKHEFFADRWYAQLNTDCVRYVQDYKPRNTYVQRLCQKLLVTALIRKNTLTHLDRNLFDCFIVLFSWLAYPLSKVPGMGCVRSVRVLRTIRVFHRIDSMRLMLTGEDVCPSLMLLCPALLTLSSASARIYALLTCAECCQRFRLR
jgi:hypothetical protein